MINKKIIINIIIGLILIVGIIFSFYKNKYKDGSNMKLRIGYEYFTSVHMLDPARIQNISESNLIENFLSRIVEYDTDGEFICVLCQKFWIDGSEINFEFRNDLKTKNGTAISASDAEFSFKRLINLDTNTHGNLLNFLEGNSPNSIYTKENILKIKLGKIHYSQFILPLLASMDFSIIPKDSVKKNSSGEWIDYQNTSGPYYLERDSDIGALVLKANKNHPLYSNEMFKDIEIVPTEYGKAIDYFLEDKIDLIDVTIYPSLPLMEKLMFQKEKQFVTSQTIPINLFLLFISPETTKDLSTEEVFYAANTISNTLLGFKRYGYGLVSTKEFFQSSNSGGLSSDQLATVLKLRDTPKNLKLKRPFVFGIAADRVEKLSNALKNHPEIEIIPYPFKKKPDAFMQTTDSSFNEDISLLSYNFSMEFFGMTKEEGNKWMKDFIDIPNKEDRIKKLQEFHMSLLERPVVYPIGASPYWAIGNEDLELNFSKTFPGSSWWKIRKK